MPDYLFLNEANIAEIDAFIQNEGNTPGDFTVDKIYSQSSDSYIVSLHPPRLNGFYHAIGHFRGAGAEHFAELIRCEAVNYLEGLQTMEADAPAPVRDQKLGTVILGLRLRRDHHWKAEDDLLGLRRGKLITAMERLFEAYQESTLFPKRSITYLLSPATVCLMDAADSEKDADYNRLAGDELNQMVSITRDLDKEA